MNSGEKKCPILRHRSLAEIAGALEMDWMSISWSNWSESLASLSDRRQTSTTWFGQGTLECRTVRVWLWSLPSLGAVDVASSISASLSLIVIVHCTLFRPKIYCKSTTNHLLWEGYLLRPVGSSSPPSPLLPASSVAEIEWFVLVCHSGVEAAIEGGVDNTDRSSERLGSGRLFTASLSCLWANTAAHFSSIACLWEGRGSAVFWGSTSLLNVVMVRFGQGTDKAPLFSDISAEERLYSQTSVRMWIGWLRGKKNEENLCLKDEWWWAMGIADC